VRKINSFFRGALGALAIAVTAHAFVLQTGDSNVYPLKWYRDVVTMDIQLSYTTVYSDGTSPRSTVAAAMMAWNANIGAVRLQASITSGSSYANGDGVNQIAMDSTIQGDAFPEGALAVTMSYTEGDSIAEADIIFNSAYQWDSYRGYLRSSEDLRRVAIHELGHVLGLDHPDQAGQNVNAIMNSRESNLDQLVADDIAGGRALYAAPGAPAPANDNFANAELLTQTPATGSNILATREPGEPDHADSTATHTLWWRWTAPSAGTLSLTTYGSSFDTVLAVYTGSAVDHLTPISANDDEESPEQNSAPTRRRTSVVSFSATPNQTYYIAVAGFGAADHVPAGYTGTIRLTPNFQGLPVPVFASNIPTAGVYPGDTATFSASATGDPAPTYRWQIYNGTWADLVEGAPYSGTATATLNVTASAEMTGAQFRCVATNVNGSGYSGPTTLYVYTRPVPTISSAPGDHEISAGTPWTMTVVANAATSYQWYFNDAPIAGATTTTLTLSGQRSEAGKYHVVASNAAGSVATWPFYISYYADSGIANVGPAMQVVTPGQSITLSATSSAPAGASFQWYHDFRAIPGATALTYVRAAATVADDGAYWLAITDANGTRHGPPRFIHMARPPTRVIGWGGFRGDVSAPESVTNARKVYSYNSGFYATTADGTVATWGTASSLGSLSGELTDVEDLATTSNALYILKSDGHVVTNDYNTSPLIGNWKNIVAISGRYALRTDGTVLGAGAPVRDMKNIVAIAAADQHQVALKADGTVLDVGEFIFFQPTWVPDGLKDVVAISAGGNHSVALKSDGTVVVWGRTDSLQTDMPFGLTDVVGISAGGACTLAQRRNGAIVAWGIYGGQMPTPPAGLGRVIAVSASDQYYFALQETTAKPVPIVLPLSDQYVQTGNDATFTVATPATTGATVQWQRNGRNIGVPSTAMSLTVPNVQPTAAGLYTAVVTTATGTTTSQAAVLVPGGRTKIVGDAREIGSDIHHPNGNIYDQMLLTGPAATVQADPGQVTRISFIDLNDDIVQVEFSGQGALTILLDNASGPGAAVKYLQPDIQYMKGHASIIVSNGDESTYVSVFSVGRANALNQSLFRSDVSYDGMADIAYLAVASGSLRFGGIFAGNASFTATNGLTGVFAPNLHFWAPVYVGDITAADNADGVFRVHSVGDARITGGDLLQLNNHPVTVEGMGQLLFTGNITSQGVPQSAQPNRAVLQQYGSDVSTQLPVTNLP
jgi:hypothetical protein